MRAASRILSRIGAGAVVLATIAVSVVALSAEIGPVEVAAVSPGNGEVLSAPPSEITVRFTKVFEAQEFHISVASQAGDVVNCGQAAANGRAISVPVVIADPGIYLVAYHVVLSDGREIAGVTDFAVIAGQVRGGAFCEAVERQPHHGGTGPIAITFTAIAVVLIVILLILLVWRMLPGKA